MTHEYQLREGERERGGEGEEEGENCHQCPLPACLALPGVRGVEELVDRPSQNKRVEKVGEIGHGLPVIALGLHFLCTTFTIL